MIPNNEDRKCIIFESTFGDRYSKQLLQIANDFPEKAVIQHKACLAVEALIWFFFAVNIADWKMNQ